MRLCRLTWDGLHLVSAPDIWPLGFNCNSFIWLVIFADMRPSRYAPRGKYSGLLVRRHYTSAITPRDQTLDELKVRARGRLAPPSCRAKQSKALDYANGWDRMGRPRPPGPRGCMTHALFPIRQAQSLPIEHSQELLEPVVWYPVSEVRSNPRYACVLMMMLP